MRCGMHRGILQYPAGADLRGGVSRWQGIVSETAVQPGIRRPAAGLPEGHL